jgi:hypothetical protein
MILTSGLRSGKAFIYIEEMPARDPFLFLAVTVITMSNAGGETGRPYRCYVLAGPPPTVCCIMVFKSARHWAIVNDQYFYKYII